MMFYHDKFVQKYDISYLAFKGNAQVFDKSAYDACILKDIKINGK